MHTIELKSWDYECGEPGCCYDYGTELILDGESITKYFDTTNGAFSDDLGELIKRLGVEVKIINTSDYVEH